MKFITSTLVIGIAFFGAVLFADQQDQKINCIQATNKVFKNFDLPLLGETCDPAKVNSALPEDELPPSCNMHEQSQGIDFTSQTPQSGYGAMVDGRSYRILQVRTQTPSLVVDIQKPLKSSDVKGQKKSWFSRFHKQSVSASQRFDLYRYAFNVVGTECQLNRVEITPNVSREESANEANTFVVDDDVCQSITPPGTIANIRVRSVCNRFKFYPQTVAADAGVTWGARIPPGQ